MQFLNIPNFVDSQDQYTGQRKVLQRAFILLKLMARGNKLVQSRLYDRLDMLLSKKGAEEELAECITEVMNGIYDSVEKPLLLIATGKLGKTVNLLSGYNLCWFWGLYTFTNVRPS